MPSFITYQVRQFVISTIRFYQKTLSFDHGPLGKVFFPHGFCRFHPTCSEYGIQAISKYGVIKGGAKTLWRIFRCNPFSKGGHDPA
jgi:putative membrane protein insertion efficiency factor